jgi:hypothetical protein
MAASLSATRRRMARRPSRDPVGSICRTTAAQVRSNGRRGACSRRSDLNRHLPAKRRSPSCVSPLDPWRTPRGGTPFRAAALPDAHRRRLREPGRLVEPSLRLPPRRPEWDHRPAPRLRTARRGVKPDWRRGLPPERTKRRGSRRSRSDSAKGARPSRAPPGAREGRGPVTFSSIHSGGVRQSTSRVLQHPPRPARWSIPSSRRWQCGTKLGEPRPPWHRPIHASPNEPLKADHRRTSARPACDHSVQVGSVNDVTVSLSVSQA